MLSLRKVINRNNRLKNKYKPKPLLSKTQYKYLVQVMAKRPIPNYILNLIEALNENCPCKVKLAGSFKGGYGVDKDSKNFEKFIHKLVRGKDKLSDIDLEFVTDPCQEMYERIKSIDDFNIEIVTNPHSHALL